MPELTKLLTRPAAESEAGSATSGANDGDEFARSQLRARPQMLLLLSVIVVLTVGPLLLLPVSSEDKISLSYEWWKLFATVVLSAFIPLLALSLFFFRKTKRAIEVRRIAKRLNADQDEFIKMLHAALKSDELLILRHVAGVLGRYTESITPEGGRE